MYCVVSDRKNATLYYTMFKEIWSRVKTVVKSTKLFVKSLQIFDDKKDADEKAIDFLSFILHDIVEEDEISKVTDIDLFTAKKGSSTAGSWTPIALKVKKFPGPSFRYDKLILSFIN